MRLTAAASLQCASEKSGVVNQSDHMYDKDCILLPLGLAIIDYTILHQ